MRGWKQRQEVDVANLLKPLECKCGNITFIHQYKPERWVCKVCSLVCAERPQRNDSDTCRVCKAKRDEKPFSKWSNICLECKRTYNKKYGVENKDKILKQHRESYQRDRSKRIAAVRTTHQRSPKAFLAAQYRHLRSRVKHESGQRLVARGKLNPACLDVQIDLDYVLSLLEAQFGRCALSGIVMVHRFNDPLAMSIDRKDSSLGYVPGNVWLVCQWVNRAKNNMSVSDFRGVLREVILAERRRLVVEREEVDDTGSVVGVFLRGVFDWVVDRFWLVPLRVVFADKFQSTMPVIDVSLRECRGGTQGEVHHSSFLVVGDGDGVSSSPACDVVNVWVYGSGIVLVVRLDDPDSFKCLTEKIESIILDEYTLNGYE